jgi:purine-binding chemotaxis protein CheW
MSDKNKGAEASDGEGQAQRQRLQRSGMQIVLFKLADIHYGVDVAQVQGVVEVENITQVPNAPSYIEGVTNLRGEVIPIIDLRRKFNMPERDSSEDYKMIVVRHGKDAVGVTVDTVMVVMDLAADVIDEIPGIVAGVDDDSFLGVAKHEDYLIVLLDLIKVVGSIDTSFVDAGLDATAEMQAVPAG